MKNLILTALLLLMIFKTGANQDKTQNLRLQLIKAQQSFEQLRDSGMLVYSVEINKIRYQNRINDIAKSRKFVSKSGLNKSDYKSAHMLASKAFIGIRGLKTAGSIGFVKKEARVLYTRGITELRSAVIELYELAKARNQKTRFKDLYKI